MDDLSRKSASVAPARVRAESKPTYIKIESAWGNYQADSVLQSNPDLIAALDKAGVKYREATAFERRVGGFVDQGE